MNYHPDDFLSLVEEAEQQGGARLTEVCKPTAFRLNLPIDDQRPDGPRANRRLTTTGCHRHAKFIVPLLPAAYLEQVELLDGEVASIPEDKAKETLDYRPLAPEDFDFNDADHKHVVMNDGTPVLAKVCAVDDAMGLWPRFQSAMHTGESFQEH